MKLITLYHPIFADTAEAFIKAMHDADGEDVTIRSNNAGGSVFAGWGMIAALTESKSNITYKVDGYAASMSTYMAMFAKDVECLDVTRFMIHRADGRVESKEDQLFLDSVNNQLREKMNEKFDSNQFQAISGVSIDALFDLEERKDVWLSAQQALEIGLVSKINRVTPEQQTAMSKMVASSEFAEKLGFVEVDDTKSKLQSEIEIINQFTKNLKNG